MSSEKIFLVVAYVLIFLLYFGLLFLWETLKQIRRIMHENYVSHVNDLISLEQRINSLAGPVQFVDGKRPVPIRPIPRADTNE